MMIAVRFSSALCKTRYMESNLSPMGQRDKSAITMMTEALITVQARKNGAAAAAVIVVVLVIVIVRRDAAAPIAETESTETAPETETVTAIMSRHLTVTVNGSLFT